jgi:hypothetical protein
LTDATITIPCSRSGEFNLLVEKNDESVWAAAHWFAWFSPGVELLAGGYRNIPYIWDMIGDNGNLVTPGIYDVVGVMYNEPWNYNNHGNPYATEVSVPITFVPEPATIFLLVLGTVMLRKPKK